MIKQRSERSFKKQNNRTLMKVRMPQDFLDEPEPLRKPKASRFTACEATLIREIPCNLTEMFFSYIEDQIESQFA
jgi:hypothetical protein